MRFRSPLSLSLVLASACASEAAAPSASAPAAQQSACVEAYADDAALAANEHGLHISEVVSDNDGVLVDALGETDDWLELSNHGSAPILLSRYQITDTGRRPARLPPVPLAPGASIILWADDAPEQGITHLDFKLSASGETLTLWTDPCTPIERVEVPSLAVNQSYARRPDGSFAACRYPTPGAANGAACSPPTPAAPADPVVFPAFTWPSDFPRTPTPLALSELALRPTALPVALPAALPVAFVEVENTSGRTLTLRQHQVRIAALAPGHAYPDVRAGHALAWPVDTLAPGARVALPVPEEAAASLAASPDFEGVVTLFEGQRVLDRADFSAWPEGAVLARPHTGAPFRLCAEATPGQPNLCTPVRRTPPDSLRALHTDDDFAALAAGATVLGQAPVKFVVDMQAGDAVHFLSDRWALHYTFVRERIDAQPPLDRCDPIEAQAFHEAWVAFSEREYFGTSTRRYLLGTLVEHANALKAVEFASGDFISAAQMRRAFLAVVARTQDPRAWVLRLANPDHVTVASVLAGTLPLVGPAAPFANQTYQPLTAAVGFGVLRFVPAVELSTAHLPAQTIVLTDDVPNDVPYVGGLITEAFQTPLAHVNVLSQARGTPNMALVGARTSARIAPLLGKLVRLEVGPRDFSLRLASAAEADAYFEARRPIGPRQVAPADLSVRGVLPLRDRGLADLPAIGAKAAQFAELYRVAPAREECVARHFSVPADAFALPVAHYADHFVASGAAALLRARQAEPAFRVDPDVRARGLAAVRDAIARHPVEPDLLAQVEAAVRARWGRQRVRFRSSSNVEDLPTFSGAGLHTSISAELGDDRRAVADALRTVWASLWNLRAYDEREAANLAQDAAQMGVLVHEAALGEAAQGVGVSRDLLDVTVADVYYINAQRGEATVTNPAPGVTTEQLLYTTRLGAPEVSYQTHSSFADGRPVLDDEALRSAACALESVHAHYQPRLDPAGTNRLFAMQIEFKLERSGRLVVKQARPQPFGHVTPPHDCR